MRSKSFAPATRTFAVLILLVTMAILFVVAFTTPSLQLTELRFNPYVLLSGSMTLADIVLFAFMLRKEIRGEEGLWLLIYLTLLTILTAAEAMQRLSATSVAALFWANMATPAAILGPVIFLFALAYTNQTEKRHYLLASLLISASLIYLFFANFTNIIFNNSTKAATLQPWGWDYTNAIGPAIMVSVLWLVGLTAVAICRLISFWRHTHNPLLRRQTSLFIIGLFVPLLAALLSAVILPALRIDIVPFATTTTAVSVSFLLYGIYHYQILTINPAQFSGTILTLMHESVIVTDNDLSIVYQNATARLLLGHDADVEHRVSLLTMMPEATITKLRHAMEATTEQFDIEEVEVKAAKGNTVPVRISGSPLKLGDFHTWILILADITKELQTRSVIEHEVDVRTHQLNEARAYLVSSINSLEQGFMLINHHSSVELSNERASTYVKLTDTELAGAEIDKATKNLDWNIDLSKLIHHVLTKHKAQHHEVAAGDGSFYQVFVTPVLTGEHVLGATVIIEDVTEEKILNRSKDEFFSIASHELRTPLTAIRGNMGMVKDYYPEAMKDESLKSMINDTHDASVRLIEIVNDFLDSSKLEQGKLQFDMQPVSVSDVATAIQKDLESLAAKREDMITIADLSKLPKVSADPTRLQQILYNLLSNAVKYSEKATITVSGSVEGDTVKIRVTDTGKGISPENQKLLFHKFQQASSSTLTREDTKGTGLGLYIARLLATNMHGNVELESSEVGKGSTFVVSMGAAG